MAELTQRKRTILALIILLSTLFFPIQLLYVKYYFLPAIYVSIIAPYLIWYFYFRKENRIVTPHPILKFISIFLLGILLLFLEMMFMTLLPEGNPFRYTTTFKIFSMVLLSPSILLIRLFVYTLMLFVWDDTLRKRFRFKVGLWLLILFFNVCMLCKLLLISALSAMVFYG